MFGSMEWILELLETGYTSLALPSQITGLVSYFLSEDTGIVLHPFHIGIYILLIIGLVKIFVPL